jgi:hypothetical protein
MEISLDDFRRHFELLSDEALLATNREDLVEKARACYDEEVQRRGLNHSPESDLVAAGGNEEETAAEDPEEAEELVLIAAYNIPDEANLARGLLQIAGIPTQMRNALAAVGGIDLKLFVPASFEEHALEILATEISDEELAAQAEAAGMTDEREEVDPEED